MAEPVQGALINEMLGRFIEDSVSRAVSERMRSLAEETDRKVAEVIEAGTSRLDAVMQTRIQQMLEQGLSSINKAMDDLSVTIQDSLMELTKENEIMFHRRCEEWIGQMHSESAESLSAVLETQVEALRKTMLQETGESAKAICDRNLFDFRSEFENHVNRCFQGVADRLSAPMTLPVRTLPVTAPVMRQ